MTQMSSKVIDDHLVDRFLFESNTRKTYCRKETARCRSYSFSV